MKGSPHTNLGLSSSKSNSMTFNQPALYWVPPPYAGGYQPQHGQSQGHYVTALHPNMGFHNHGVYFAHLPQQISPPSNNTQTLRSNTSNSSASMENSASNISFSCCVSDALDLTRSPVPKLENMQGARVQNIASNSCSTSNVAGVNVTARIVRQKFERLSEDDKDKFYEGYKKKRLKSVMQFYGNFTDPEFDYLQDFISLQLDFNSSHSHSVSSSIANHQISSCVANQNLSNTPIESARGSAPSSAREDASRTKKINKTPGDACGSSASQRLEIPRNFTEENMSKLIKEDAPSVAGAATHNSQSEQPETQQKESIAKQKHEPKKLSVSSIVNGMNGDENESSTLNTNELTESMPRTRLQHRMMTMKRVVKDPDAMETEKQGTEDAGDATEPTTSEKEKNVKTMYYGKEHSCPVSGCNKVYGNRKQLVSHFQMHRGCKELPFKCQFCNYVSDTKRSIASHTAVCHKGASVRAYTCNWCKRKFETHKQFALHESYRVKNKRCALARAPEKK